MRVLHCTHNYHPARGGAETLMKGVSDRLARRGHDVRVLATNARSTEDYFLPGRGKDILPAGTETIDGVTVTRVPFSRSGAPLLNALRAGAVRWPLPLRHYWRMLSWGPRSGAYRRAARAATAGGGVDLVVAGPLPTLAVRHARRVARQAGLPLIIVPCFHTEDAYAFHNPRYYRWMREAEAVVCLTDWEADFLHAVAGVPRDRLNVIGVGLDAEGEGPSETEIAEARAAIRARYGLTGDGLVLFLGQHAIHKGLLTLVEAMETAWRLGGSTADLVIAGNPTAFTPTLEARVAGLPEGLRGRVRFVHGIPEGEKREILRAADVFVSVSPYESFGIVYLEAWREKRPVIGCLRGAAARLIDDHRDGLLVDDGQAGPLAGAILDLLADAGLRRRMGERGWAKVRERYDWDRVVDRWEELYRDVVQRHVRV